MLAHMAHTVLHLDDLDRIPIGDVGIWRAVRRALGVTGFGTDLESVRNDRALR
jgi:hypothetical protein